MTSATSTADCFSNNDSSTTTKSWKLQLLQASNIASILCVVDCTVLPLVTVVLPFFGLVAATPVQTEFLHRLGHSLALWFVLPVGGSATLLNYLYAHQQKKIAALGALGLWLVYATNAPQGVFGSSSSTMEPALLYAILRTAHHGAAHRLVNVLGCACLLGSNYLSRKSGKCLHGPECCDHKC